MLFLPPYSPDLNPIEKYGANMKMKIRDLLPSVASLSVALDQVILSM
jgi:transposase